MAKKFAVLFDCLVFSDRINNYYKDFTRPFTTFSMRQGYR